MLLSSLIEMRAARVKDVVGMEARARKTIWWPFTQHDNLGEGSVSVIDSAFGDYFCMADVVKDSGSSTGGAEGEVRPEEFLVGHRFPPVAELYDVLFT